MPQEIALKSPDLMESFSGVRGIFGQGITEDLAYRYAVAYCKLNNPSPFLVIAADSRSSGAALKKAITRGFQDSGIKEIFDLGVVPVQVCEYYIIKHQLAGGIYISASHNEPEYNGWKMLWSDGAILSPEQSEQVIAAVHNSIVSTRVASDANAIKAHHRQAEGLKDYLDYVAEQIGPEPLEQIRRAHFRLLLDPNGGSAIVLLEPFLKLLGVKAEIVHGTLGRFERLMEPKAESLTPLVDHLAKGNFEFAGGFDCDADRVELVINPQSQWASKMGGAVLSGQYVLALACDSVLAKTNNQVVVTNDATSYLTREVIKKHQATVKEVEVGEINVVRGIDAHHSLIGGEGSNGGVIIPPVKCRDGFMTIALILKMLARKGESLLEVLEGYPDFFSQRTKASCLPSEAIAIRAKIEEYFCGLGYGIIKTGDDTGGLKALLDSNSFVWFRQSKTEPGVFRIHAEADSAPKASQLLQEGIKAFNQVCGLNF